MKRGFIIISTWNDWSWNCRAGNVSSWKWLILPFWVRFFCLPGRGQSGKRLTYLGAVFHCVIPGFVAIAGDAWMRWLRDNEVLKLCMDQNPWKFLPLPQKMFGLEQKVMTSWMPPGTTFQHLFGGYHGLLYRYGYWSIPINTIFSGMNIHLPAILMFTRGTRFWHTAIWETKKHHNFSPNNFRWPRTSLREMAPGESPFMDTPSKTRISRSPVLE